MHKNLNFNNKMNLSISKNDFFLILKKVSYSSLNYLFNHIKKLGKFRALFLGI